MIQQLEKAISKLSQLSESEQELIAQMIMTTIENKKEKKNGYVEDDPYFPTTKKTLWGDF